MQALKRSNHQDSWEFSESDYVMDFSTILMLLRQHPDTRVQSIVKVLLSAESIPIPLRLNDVSLMATTSGIGMNDSTGMTDRKLEFSQPVLKEWQRISDVLKYSLDLLPSTLKMSKSGSTTSQQEQSNKRTRINEQQSTKLTAAGQHHSNYGSSCNSNQKKSFPQQLKSSERSDGTDRSYTSGSQHSQPKKKTVEQLAREKGDYRKVRSNRQFKR